MLVDGVRVVVHFNFEWHVDHVFLVAAERGKKTINFREVTLLSPFHSCGEKDYAFTCRRRHRRLQPGSKGPRAEPPAHPADPETNKSHQLDVFGPI
jgi:hypothetical protein